MFLTNRAYCLRNGIAGDRLRWTARFWLSLVSVFPNDKRNAALLGRRSWVIGLLCVNDLLGDAGLAQEDDQDDKAEGNQGDEKPAPALTGIIQTADGECQTGNESDQTVNKADVGNKTQNKAEDKVNQNCPPVATDVGAAGKIEVVLPHIHIAVDHVCHKAYLSFFDDITSIAHRYENVKRLHEKIMRLFVICDTCFPPGWLPPGRAVPGP